MNAPIIAKKFNPYRLPKAGCFAVKGEGDRLVEEGDNGERRNDGSVEGDGES